MNWKDELRHLCEDAKKGKLLPTEFHVDDQFEDRMIYFDMAPLSREDIEAFLKTVKEMLV